MTEGGPGKYCAFAKAVIEALRKHAGKDVISRWSRPGRLQPIGISTPPPSGASRWSCVASAVIRPSRRH